MEIDKNNNFNNPAAASVIVYSEEDVKVKEGTNFTASVYTLKHIHAEDAKVNPTTMTGSYIAEKIDSKKSVIWN